MIKYNLKCKNNHEFESWFSESKEFERLKTKKLLECQLDMSIELDRDNFSLPKFCTQYTAQTCKTKQNIIC